MTIENTSQRDPAMHVLGASVDGVSGYVGFSELAGQYQAVHSDRLPTKGSDNPELAGLGIALGEVDERDPLFRKATLPAGWTRAAADDSRGSHLVDPLGRRRGVIFYKAAGDYAQDRLAELGWTKVLDDMGALKFFNTTPPVRPRGPPHRRPLRPRRQPRTAVAERDRSLAEPAERRRASTAAEELPHAGSTSSSSAAGSLSGPIPPVRGHRRRFAAGPAAPTAQSSRDRASGHPR